MRADRTKSLTAALLTVLIGAALVVQAKQQQQPTFRTDTDLVRLNVTVLDKERRPIRGLMPADFVVRVNGQEQPVVVAVEESATAPVAVSAGFRNAPLEVFTNQLEEPRLFVIILDDIRSTVEAFYLENTRRAARAVVEQLGPNDLAAVVYTWDNFKAQDFTRDRSRLLASIDAFTPGPPGHPSSNEISARALRKSMDFLSRMPGLRAAIFYIGPGGLPQSEGRRFGQPLGSWGADVADDKLEGGQSLYEEWSALSSQAAGNESGYRQLAQIPIYGIHPAGLVAPNDARFTVGGVGLGNRILERLASNTGGRAVINTNDPLPGVAEIFDELSSWYVIGYRPTHALNDGRIRRFQVRVRRPGAAVYPPDRPFLSPKPSSTTAANEPVPASTRALSKLVPDAGLPLAVHLAPFHRPITPDTERPSSIAVSLALPRASVAGTTATQERLDVEIRVFDGEGLRAYGTEHRQVTWTVDPTQPTQGVDLVTTLTLKPGRYAVRIGVHHPGRNETGSVYADLTVPDFAKAPLSASGVTLSAAGRTAVPPGALADVLSMVPTTQRTFRATDTVRAYLELYQGGNAAAQEVSLRIQLVNTADAVVFSHEQRLVAASFTGQPHMVPVAMDVPLSTLPPGEYLMTFDAATSPKQTVTRHVRVRVQ